MLEGAQLLQIQYKALVYPRLGREHSVVVPRSFDPGLGMKTSPILQVTQERKGGRRRRGGETGRGSAGIFGTECLTLIRHPGLVLGCGRPKCRERRVLPQGALVGIWRSIARRLDSSSAWQHSFGDDPEMGIWWEQYSPIQKRHSSSIWRHPKKPKECLM